MTRHLSYLGILLNRFISWSLLQNNQTIIISKIIIQSLTSADGLEDFAGIGTGGTGTAL